MLKRFVWRGIGPASMGGRIDDIVAVDSNPYIYYVGFATGGVWKTVNNGTTFQPVFDTYSTASIGDIAIAPSNPDIVWVGTGEANNRQSSSFGDGIYKSTDAGKTFTKMGLENSQTIARIVIDPKDPNTVYVAVLGHLFGPKNAEFTKPPTAARHGTTLSSSTKTRALPISLWTRPTTKRSTPRLTSDAELPGALMAAGRDPESGRRPMPERPGRNFRGTACRRACSDESASMFRDRIRTSSMRRWKLEPA
jgi:hypothetical protein